MSNLRLAIVGALLVLAGCSENCSCLIIRPPNSHVQHEVFHKAATAAHLATKDAPKPQHPGKGVFGNEIEFVGYDLEPPVAQAGAPIIVTYYFHALRDVTRDWEIFVHIDDKGGRQERINGDHWPESNQFHTDQWKQGDYIADRFSFTIPAYQAHTALDLWMGFYSGDERLPISNPKDCENDGNNRLLSASLPIP